MAFGDQFQQEHMMAGVRKALSSPRTPLHLRPHLEARAKGGNMKPVKTIVPAGPTRPIKTVVGSTQQSPRKTTAANLGAGSNGPRPRGVLAQPNSTARQAVGTQHRPIRDGKSVNNFRKASGPGNPVLDNRGGGGVDYGDAVKSGGMGQNGKLPRAKFKARRSAFYGE